MGAAHLSSTSFKEFPTNLKIRKNRLVGLNEISSSGWNDKFPASDALDFMVYAAVLNEFSWKRT